MELLNCQCNMFYMDLAIELSGYFDVGELCMLFFEVCIFLIFRFAYFTFSFSFSCCGVD